MTASKIHQIKNNFFWITCSLLLLSDLSYSFSTGIVLENPCNMVDRAEFVGGSWLGGIYPTASTDAYINENYATNLFANGSFVCKNLTLASNITLTIKTDDYVEVLEEIIVPSSSKIIIEKGGNLVQRCVDCKNIYQIVHEHETRLIENHEYAYWCSPIKENIVKQVTDAGMGRCYYQQNYWRSLTQSTNLDAGMGFIAFNPNESQKFNLKFTGTANTGKISFPNLIQDDNPMNPSNWALAGNPYPSAINLIDFITHPNNQHLQGAIYFWSNYKCDNSVENCFAEPSYMTWNLCGSTRTTNQLLDNEGQSFDATNFCPSGQPFMVLVRQNTEIYFDNSMRSKIGNRKNLYKSTIENASRLWLNISSSSNNFDQMLLAYINGATVEEDRLYDAFDDLNGEINIYSVINEFSYKIQGRPLENIKLDEIISLGIKSSIDETSEITISIDRFENEFVGKAIILRDKYLSIDHDLKSSNYVFKSKVGTFNDRFELILGGKNMSTEKYETSTLMVFNTDVNLYVEDVTNSIKSASLYDLTGRLISEKKNVTDSKITFEKQLKSNQILILKVEYLNGQTVTRKTYF